MPEDRLQLITNSPLLQLLQRSTNELEGSRIKLLPLLGSVGIPVVGDRRAADRRLDDRHWCVVLCPQATGKGQFHAERLERAQRFPALELVLRLASQIGVEHFGLRRAGSLEHRILINPVRPRIRAHHVRLAREEKDFDRLRRLGGVQRAGR